MKNKQWSCAEIQLTLIKALLEIDNQSGSQIISDETQCALYSIHNELIQELKEYEEK